jgi:hypothetical protein
VTFGFSSPVEGYAAFYPVVKVPIAICLWLTRGLRIFLGINILSWEASGAQEVNEGGHEAQTVTSGVGP